MVKIYPGKRKNKVVATVKDETSTSPDYISQESQCEKCQNNKAKFRPLVNNNGTYLCDRCYRSHFPATAMCDENMNNNVFTNLNQRIQEKKREMMNANMNRVCPEEEECCTCLEHGVYRRCCKKYYCRECYFKNNSCPGCQKPNHRFGYTRDKTRPTVIAVLASWGLSISLIIIILIFLAFVVVHVVTKPQTIWSHSCEGWWPQCSEPVCLDFPSENVHLATELPYEYKYCSINETKYKVVGDACIFDHELYRWSRKLMGFDLCVDSNRKATHILYQSGVYVFEDNFDYWADSKNHTSASVKMRSAQWANLQNGQTSGICGYSALRYPYESEIDLSSNLNRQNSSLVFSGHVRRFVETIDLNLINGGRIEFYLKLAPIVLNELATRCKTAFNGKVFLRYSVDGGGNYSLINEYPVWKYRNEEFTFVQEVIPSDAQTSSVRFRWEQDLFDAQRDYWALDNVRIFHQWKSSISMYENMNNRHEAVQSAQCCFDTEQCKDLPNLQESCETYHSKHDISEDYSFRLRIADMYTILTSVLLVSKFFLQELHRWQSNSLNKKFALFHQKPELNHATSRQSYELKVSKTWQRFAFTLLIIPQCIISSILFNLIIKSWSFYSEKTLSFIFLIVPWIIDLWTLRHIAMDVIHYWPFHIPPEVTIDETTEKGLLVIDNMESIPLSEITNVEIYSFEFYVKTFVSVWMSALPITTGCVFIRLTKLMYSIHIVLVHILGLSSIIRSILGSLWFVEFFFSTMWLLDFSESSRDELGRAFNQISFHSCASITVLSLLLATMTFNAFFGELKTANLISVISLTIFIGIVIGLTIAMLRGLPIVPKIHLTVWPEDGYFFVHRRESRSPQLLSKLLSGGSNSVVLYILSVDKDLDMFHSFLKGSLTFSQLTTLEGAES